MKLTKTKLKQIIKEEINSVMKEAQMGHIPGISTAKSKYEGTPEMKQEMDRLMSRYPKLIEKWEPIKGREGEDFEGYYHKEDDDLRVWGLVAVAEGPQKKSDDMKWKDGEVFDLKSLESALDLLDEWPEETLDKLKTQLQGKK